MIKNMKMYQFHRTFWSTGLLYFVLMSLTMDGVCLVQAAADKALLFEKAEYHLKELKKTLEQIENFDAGYKSSVSETDDNPFQSFVSLCSLFDSKGQTKMTTASTTPPIVWPKPDIFPVKVMAEHKGDKVMVKFDILHSSKMYVSEKNNMNWTFKKIFVKAPKKNEEFAISPVQFDVDISRCFWNPPIDANLYYTFSNTNGPGYFAHILFDVCKFDRHWMGELDISNNKEAEENEEINNSSSQVFSEPKFLVLSGADEDGIVFIQKGKDTAIDVQVFLKNDNEFSAHVMVWDWLEKKYFLDVVRISVSTDKPKTLIVSNSTQDGPMYKKRLLEVRILSEENLGSSWEFKGILARIRITVKIGSELMSGKLMTHFDWFEIVEGSGRSFVEYLATARIFWLRLPYKLTSFPEDEVEIKIRNFSCDNRGNRYETRHGNNCTISCQAYGPGIKYLFIVKAYPYRPPVKSVFSYFAGIAETKQDVGPASSDNEGKYRCVALTTTGKITSKEFTLISSRFTKIEIFTIEDLKNASSRIVCTAYGVTPLNISLTLIDRGDRQLHKEVEKRPGNNANISSGPDYTSLTVILDTSQLGIHQKKLICRANGERGEDTQSIKLN